MKRLFFMAVLMIGPTATMHAGVVACPDAFYAAIPITGVTDGEATSCGNAGVTSNSAFAATPGNGSVAESILATYLGVSFPVGVNSRFSEGSAVQFANFTAPSGSTLSFDWDGVFEPGAAGMLFYVLNGSLTALQTVQPEPLDALTLIIPKTVTVPLLTGSNTAAFGAISIVPFDDRGFTLVDPQLNVTNLAVNNSGVPEPATFALTGVVLAGLALLGRRRL